MLVFRSLSSSLMGLQHSHNVNRLAEARSHNLIFGNWHESIHNALSIQSSLFLKGFSDLLEHKPFWNRFCALGVDEFVHKDFLWMHYVRGGECVCSEYEARAALVDVN